MAANPFTRITLRYDAWCQVVGAFPESAALAAIKTAEEYVSWQMMLVQNFGEEVRTYRDFESNKD